MTPIGRRTEADRLRGMLRDERLVTVTGPGGAGKSTLAAEAVRDRDRRHRLDLVHVDLAAVSDPALVRRWLRHALRRTSPSERRPALLVVDTCEHVAAVAGAELGALLEERPALRAMATSRVPVAGRSDLRLGPMPTDEAVELFDACAPGTGRLEGADAETVREICELLDGLPLTVRIAASQLRRMSPAELLERLSRPEGCLDLLAAGPYGPERQRSLRDSLHWTSRLCTAEEQLLWARASVFPGGFALKDATAVCTDEQLPETSLATAFAGLAAQGLFAPGAPGPLAAAARVRLPRAARAYGREHLAQLGEEAQFQRRCVLWSMGAVVAPED